MIKFIKSKCSNIFPNEIDRIKAKGLANGLSPEEIDFTLQEAMFYAKEVKKRKKSTTKIKLKWIVVLLSIGCGLYSNKPTHNFIVRNYQEMIYPFMALLRQLTLPIIKQFPFLTEFYDESCLIENPYFRIEDMECWPCEDVRFVLNLTDNNHPPYHVGIPVLIKDSEKPVGFDDIRKVYRENSKTFETHASRLFNHYQGFWINVDQFFEYKFQEKDYFIWKISRMEPGRALRTLTKPPRDHNVPDYATAINVERFLLFNGHSAYTHELPLTEGPNVYVKQLFGQRLIVLEPSPECKQTCKRISLLMEPQQICNMTLWK